MGGWNHRGLWAQTAGGAFLSHAEQQSQLEEESILSVDSPLCFHSSTLYCEWNQSMQFNGQFLLSEFYSCLYGCLSAQYFKKF